MKRETRLAVLKDIYQMGITDDDITEEAIATLESYFDNAPPVIAYAQSRIYALAYIALLSQEEDQKKELLDWMDTQYLRDHSKFTSDQMLWFNSALTRVYEHITKQEDE